MTEKPKYLVVQNDIATLTTEDIEIAARALYLEASLPSNSKSFATIEKVRQAILGLLAYENGHVAIMLDSTHENYEATAHPNNFWR